jgi:hypothetical protein
MIASSCYTLASLRHDDAAQAVEAESRLMDVDHMISEAQDAHYNMVAGKLMRLCAASQLLMTALQLEQGIMQHMTVKIQALGTELLDYRDGCHARIVACAGAASATVGAHSVPEVCSPPMCFFFLHCFAA